MKSTKSSLTKRFKRVRCLLLDVDGVLTDGKLHFDAQGGEMKSFDIQDGHGIAVARKAGLLVGFVSGRPSPITERRAKELGVEVVKLGPVNKWQMVEEIKRQHQLADEEICFVGDDLLDLPVLNRVGVAVAVANAVPEVKAAAHYVTKRTGGSGAVREVVELLLKARGAWPGIVAKHIAVGLFAGLLAFSAWGEQPKSPVPAVTGYIEKFEVPERDEQGNLKWKLMGDKALFNEDGSMTVFNMRAEFFTSNRVALVFTTPVCQLDRANKRGHTDAPVRLARDNVVMTGTGADWDADTASFMVHSNVQVVITGSVTNAMQMGLSQ